MTIRVFAVPAAVADQLDRFYNSHPFQPYGRPIRRVSDRYVPPGSAQLLEASEFALSVVRTHARPSETLHQAIYRLAGGVGCADNVTNNATTS